MHEMALAQGILELLEENAGKHGFSRVRTVWLEIGALSGAEAEAIRFCFDAVTKGTLAEGAAFEIIATAGQAWCLDCAATVTIAARYDPCPRCGGYGLQVTGGTEMRVKELAVE